MKRFDSPPYILLYISIVLFVVSLVMLLLSGVDFGTALIWNVLSSLDINFTFLPQSVVASPLVLVASALDAFIFALLAVGLATIFFDFIKQINIRKRFVAARIKHLNQHVIVVPYNNFAHNINKELKNEGVRSVIITQNESDASRLYRQNELAIVADPKLIETYTTAEISNAKYVIACDEDDIQNALIVVTVKSANARAKIISRVNNLENVPKLGSAGAYRMIMPEVTIGTAIGEEIAKRF